MPGAASAEGKPTAEIRKEKLPNREAPDRIYFWGHLVDNDAPDFWSQKF